MKCDEGKCGFNDIKDNRCCYFCEFKNNCEGFCIEIELDFMSEAEIKECKSSIK